MKISLIARTRERDDYGEFDDLKNLEILGGKLAGLCYMPDDYLSKSIQNVDSAIKRAELTSKSGHHSVFDHGYLTLIIEDIPKILAMIINSTKAYNTSEKSGRYTIMKPETDRELELYNKWYSKIKEEIGKKYNDLDSSTVDKLSKENARYMISIFTPATMAFSTSYRHLCYILDWSKKLESNLGNIQNEFSIKLRDVIRDFISELEKVIGKKVVTDNKDRYYEFIPGLNGIDIRNHKDVYGDVYTTKYSISLVGLAQLERHRTLDYKTLFNGDMSNAKYYIPKILTDNEELVKEWLDDIRSISYCIPQGTLVDVIESGTFENFALKCKERLCGRAQLEVMENTKDILEKFMSNRDLLNSLNIAKLDDMVYNGLVPKCGFRGYKCKEVCKWGYKYGLNRSI